MRRLTSFELCLALLVVSLTIVSPASAAWPTNPAVTVPLCTASADQFNPVGCSDGAGGAIYAWVDYRAGNADVYAQRVSSTGLPLWTADGVVVCNAAGDQGRQSAVPQLSVVSDGSGGAYITWEDRRTAGTTGIDVYAQRINANGSAAWTANGVAVTTATGNQSSPCVIAASPNMCFVAWLDATGFGSIGNQRFFNGVPAAPQNGVPLVSGTGGFSVWDIGRGVSDGAGGYYLAIQRFNGGTQLQQLVHASFGLFPLWTNTINSQSAISSSIHFDDILEDGAGGAIVLDDFSTGAPLGSNSVEIYRASSTGVVLYQNTTIAATGVLATSQTNASAIPDGNGGAYVAWQDSRNSGSNALDIYAQYVTGSGVLQYGPFGLVVCSSGGDQTYPRGCADGSGGAIFVWEDRRLAGNPDSYAQRFTPSGAYWTSGGLPVELVIGAQYQPWPVYDGNGGAIVAWGDARSGIYDIYCDRMDRTGYFGDPAPAMAGVRDVPNDQGGHVKVQWRASYLDAEPSYLIGSYTVWRSIPPNAALLAIAGGASLVSADEDPARIRGRAVATSSFAGQTIYWEYLGSQPAAGDPGYSYDAPTSSDSTTTSNPRTLFRVIARASSGTLQWSSQPDSGYSVDNLSPATPTPFHATFSGGVTSLHWGVNGESDLFGYRLYRGNTAGFTPGPSNLVVAKPDTGFVDAGGSAGSYYKLAAVDVHGNVSGYALASPGGITGVDDPLEPALAFAPVSPDPAHGPMTLRFTLPDARDVELTVTDLGGRSVISLARARFTPGAHAIAWSGRDASGRAAPSGIYFATLSAGSDRRVHRFAIVR